MVCSHGRLLSGSVINFLTSGICNCYAGSLSAWFENSRGHRRVCSGCHLETPVGDGIHVEAVCHTAIPPVLGVHSRQVRSVGYHLDFVCLFAPLPNNAIFQKLADALGLLVHGNDLWVGQLLRLTLNSIALLGPMGDSCISGRCNHSEAMSILTGVLSDGPEHRVQLGFF